MTVLRDADVLARLEIMEAKVARLDALEAEVRVLRNDNRIPRGENRAVESIEPSLRPATPPGPATAGQPDHVGRRRLLRTGLVAGATAAGAVLFDSPPAAAAQGDVMIVGQTNDAGTGSTQINTAIGNFTPAFVVRNTVNGDAIRGESTHNAGVYGISTGTGSNSSAPGVHGSSDLGDGVYGASTNLSGVHGVSSAGAGVLGESGTVAVSGNAIQNGAGGLFTTVYGPHLSLQSNGGRTPPPQDGIAHISGEIYRDLNADLWFCAADGTPGTWRKLAGPSTAGALHVLPTPVRVYDSRPFTIPNQAPKTVLVPNTARTIDFTVNSSTVPAGAAAAMVNVLLVNAAVGNGNFTIWANGATRPLANTMVWGGNAQRFSSLAVTALDALAKVQVQASNTTDLVLDVVGYYR